MQCLITDHVHPYLLDSLSKNGILCTYLPNISPEEVRQKIGDYEIVVVNSKVKMPADLIDEGKKLKIVGRLGSGMDGIDVDYMESKGITFFRTPEANANAVAEHAVGMLFALANRLVQCDANVRQDLWHREQCRGWELSKKTVGVIGCGHTGSLFVKKISGLVDKVLCYDKYKDVAEANGENILSVTQEKLLAEADIVSLHIPLTAETNQMVNADFIAKCKSGVIIINTSRGGVVHTEDLTNALIRGNVSGACLDVFDSEKPHLRDLQQREIYAKLNAVDNVVLSPHVAGWTMESFCKISKILSDKIVFKLA